MKNLTFDFGPTRFIDTRSHANDPQTSRDAAVNAVSDKADSVRKIIYQAIKASVSMTAREIAAQTGIDFVAINRRLSEVGGIKRNGERRDGCAAWVAT